MKMRDSVGMMSRLQIGDRNIPPTITQASGCCTCAPMPVEIAAGTSPMQSHISGCLTSLPPGPINVISVCAGDGRDLCGVLSTHERARDVTARLVEINPDLTQRGTAAIDAARLGNVISYVLADATQFGTYVSMAPADLIVMAGIFGNVRPMELAHLVDGLPCLCRPGAFVVWTRHGTLYDGVTTLRNMRERLSQTGFVGVAENMTSATGFVIGTHRYGGVLRDLPEDQQWFQFGAP